MLIKHAAETIRKLAAKVETLEQESEKLKHCEALLKKLAYRNDMSLDELFQKKADLETSSLEDLKILEKAMDLSHGSIKLGKLSKETSELSAAEKFVSALYED